MQFSDAAGRPRSPVTLPPSHAGRPPPNKGRSHPADPPRPEEIIAVMRQACKSVYGERIKALIVVLWRSGLRISEALLPAESDLEPSRLLVRRGKGGRRREVGMDDWGWEGIGGWLEHRLELPVGPVFCVIDGPTRGRAWTATAASAELRRLALAAGVRRGSRRTSYATRTRSR